MNASVMDRFKSIADDMNVIGTDDDFAVYLCVDVSGVWMLGFHSIDCGFNDQVEAYPTCVLEW